MSERTCTLPDCDKPHRARGLCSTHYNQTHGADRHKKVTTYCAGCGATVLKYKSGDRRPTCSQRCKYFVTWGKWPASQEVVHVGRRPRDLPPQAVTIVEPTKRGFVSGSCLWCGEHFVFDYRTSGIPSFTCSQRCARKRNRASCGGRFRPPDALRIAIYVRDGYQCQLCGEATEPDADPLSDWFPSLDHITPRSQGGSDAIENLRTSHRWCNLVRGDDTYYTAADLVA